MSWVQVYKSIDSLSFSFTVRLEGSKDAETTAETNRSLIVSAHFAHPFPSLQHIGVLCISVLHTTSRKQKSVREPTAGRRTRDQDLEKKGSPLQEQISDA
jgi:hypothetical protein